MDKYKILVLEDDRELNNAISDKLKEEGFNVISAYDGVEGERIALSEHPNGILLDIVLPEKDGLEVLKAIRADKWGKTAPVVVLTNMGDIENISKAVEYESSDYIVKAEASLDDIVSRLKSRMGV